MGNFLCKLLDHKLPAGYARGRPYIQVKSSAVDGIGQHHLYLYSVCDRCSEEYHVASIHVPQKYLNGLKYWYIYENYFNQAMEHLISLKDSWKPNLIV